MISLYDDTHTKLGLLFKERLSPYDLYGGRDQSLLTGGKKFSPWGAKSSLKS